MRRYKVGITVDASGNATAYTPRVSGKLHSITYVPDGTIPYANTVDATITAEATGEAILSKSNISGGFTAYPRAAVHGVDGASSLYAAGGLAVQDKIGLGNDRVKIVLAQGGNAKTGAFIVIVD